MAVANNPKRPARPRPPRPKLAGAPTVATSAVSGRSGDHNFMTSLARGLAVIGAFSERGRTCTTAELSRAVGFPRAAVRRCLYTLEQLGYVGSAGAGFFLQPRILTLGYAYLSSNNLASSAQPVLERLCALVQEASSLATLSGDEIVYVARATTGKRIMSIDITVGTRLPAYVTSMGRVLLAHLSPAALDAVLANLELRAFTDRTVASRQKLRHILGAVQRSGFCIVDQELEVGLRSIAVPIRDASGRVTAAVNIGTHALRFGVREMEAKLLPPLRAAASEISSIPR